MAQTKTVLQVTTPVGRLVSGSLYRPVTTDYEGNPREVKNGPNKGQPLSTMDFGVAFPKTPGVTHWANEPALDDKGQVLPTAGLVNGTVGQQSWLAAIWALGHAEFPAHAQRPDFSWKVLDGDDTMPNKKGNKNCDKEGWPGHWVVMFSSTQGPKIVDYLNAKGAELTDDDAVKRGYFVQVMCEFVSNAPAPSPGLYANHQAVALIAYGPVMRGGDVDVSKAGFGVGVTLPAGASTVPPAATGATPPPPAAAAAPAPAANTPPPPVAQAAPAPAPQPPTPPAPVQPAHDLTRVMLPAAEGIPYEEWIKQGWNDDLLRQHGKMA